MNITYMDTTESRVSRHQAIIISREIPGIMDIHEHHNITDFTDITDMVAKVTECNKSIINLIELGIVAQTVPEYLDTILAGNHNFLPFT
jgi:hypothetical protein